MLIVKVKKKNIEAALKQYKFKVYKTKQLEKIRDGEQYTKDSEKNREKKKKAIYKDKKRRDSEWVPFLFFRPLTSGELF